MESSSLKFNTSKYIYTDPNTNHEFSFKDLKQAATEVKRNWWRDNYISAIAVTTFVSMSFFCGSTCIIGGILGAGYYLSIAPLIYCPLGLIIIGLTVKSIWNNSWCSQSIEVYFLPHFFKTLKDDELIESTRFIRFYSFFNTSTSPAYRDDLEIMAAINESLLSLQRAASEEDENEKDRFIQNAQESCKRVNLENSHYFNQRNDIKLLFEKIQENSIKVIETIENLGKNKSFKALLKAVESI